MNRHLGELCQRVAEPFLLEGSDLLRGGRGTKSVSKARRVAIWFIWTTWEPRPSTTEIARMFGFKDHQNTRDAVSYVELQIQRGTDVGKIVERLREKEVTE